jgi:hypothetical protein
MSNSFTQNATENKTTHNTSQDTSSSPSKGYEQDSFLTPSDEVLKVLQAHFICEEGNIYALDDLRQAVSHWLELSVESLMEDVLFHVVDGDRNAAFNRRSFELQMAKLHPLNPIEDSETPCAEADRSLAA